MELIPAHILEGDFGWWPHPPDIDSEVYDVIANLEEEVDEKTHDYGTLVSLIMATEEPNS